jgi:hypothetical protein
MSELTDLIAKTRELVGDSEHEGNTTAFDQDQVVIALNLAQSRLAEITHCTYCEADAVIDENGLIDFDGDTPISNFGVMAVDRVRAEEPSTEPVATITASNEAPVVADFPITASVSEQADATYLWQASGVSILSGQGTNEISVDTPKTGKIFLLCAVEIHGLSIVGTKTLTVSD